MIRFDDHDFFQYFLVAIQLREERQEIIGIYLDQLPFCGLKIGAMWYLHES
jgi:hypothetical protein